MSVITTVKINKIKLVQKIILFDKRVNRWSILLSFIFLLYQCKQVDFVYTYFIQL